MTALYTLKIVTDFASAHTLRDYPGDCSRMHGHNWKVEVEVKARQLDAVGMGVDFKEINEFYKKAMRRKGYKVKHSVGHGVGSQVHEWVRELKPGMVVTVEPGIYFRDFAGCRVEDMVLITKGKPRLLSKSVVAFV